MCFICSYKDSKDSINLDSDFAIRILEREMTIFNRGDRHKYIPRDVKPKFKINYCPFCGKNLINS